MGFAIALTFQQNIRALSEIIMWLGFSLAAYSVVGNDVIQTLGTFLSSNEKLQKWYVLWAFAGGIMTTILIIGYLGWGNYFGLGGDDIAFDRLDKIVVPEELAWYYIVPPLVLMLLTRVGIPVSTTFLILTFFSAKSLPGMVQKSLMGYVIAFGFAAFIYIFITRLTERRFLVIPLDYSERFGIWSNKKFWIVAQWISTGFLWSQWLSQDLANIYVYLGKGDLSLVEFIISLVILVGLLGYIFYSKGGKIQDIVRGKNNTDDIRSATFIDLIYGIVLLIFKQDILGLWDAKLPMSTTWVFIGLLAGRELAMAWKLDGRITKGELYPIYRDVFKVFLGLVMSVVLVYLMNFLKEM